MKDFSRLEQLGLTKQEVAIYLHLLQNGKSTVAQIARGTRMSATNCYHLLSSLEKQSLIQQLPNATKKQFIARDPQSLVRKAELQKETAESLVPELRALYAIEKNKPTIRFFEGIAGIKEIYLELLESKSFITVGSTSKLSQRDDKFFRSLAKKVRDKQIVVQDILSPASADIAKQTKELLKGYYDAKYLSLKKGEEIATDILVWNDTVALITLDEPIFGTVITQPFIAQTMRIVLSNLWEQLQQKR